MIIPSHVPRNYLAKKVSHLIIQQDELEHKIRTDISPFL
jgi:hypothetical protein